MAKFQYVRRSVESYEKAASGSGDFEGIFKDEFNTYKVKTGDNHIRILPPTWPEAGHYAYTVHVHYSVGPRNASVLCPSKMKNERCPICEAASAAERAGEDSDAVYELRPTKRMVAWILDRKKEDDGPLLWAMPHKMVDLAILALCKDPETGELFYIDDPKEGYNISFQRQGTGKTNTVYNGFQLGRRVSSVAEKWLDYIAENPIPDTFVWRSYKEIKALFEGGAAPQEEENPRQVARQEARSNTRDQETREREEEDERPRVPAGRIEPRRTQPAPSRTEPEDDEPQQDSGKSRAAALRDKYAQRNTQRAAPDEQPARTLRARADDLEDEIPF